MLSLVIPVYRNEANITALLAALTELARLISDPMEVVLVVDGSPDMSWHRLETALPKSGLNAQLLLLSRNFGSFAAIRAGLAAARGRWMAVMAADLQEPPELILEFNRLLRSDQADITLGVRTGRDDPRLSQGASSLFWGLYRRLVQPEVPAGGIDIFGCSRQVRNVLVAMPERNSSLIGMLMWSGFRRAHIPYRRRARDIGTSSWTLRKRIRYLTDSIFGFTDLPVRALTAIGAVGLTLSLLLSVLVMTLRLSGAIYVPGYSATMLIVMFFGALNCFGLGIIGNYVWRTFENTKARPNYIVANTITYEANPPPAVRKGECP